MLPALLAQDMELDETVIIASRIEEKATQTAGSSAAITSDELLQSGAVDLIDAFEREPGVSIPFDIAGSDALVPYLQGGSNSINIRGLEGNRVNINIDGIRQPEDFVARSFDGAGGPGRIYFDPAVFAQMEVYKSASSSLYGSDALAGTFSGRTEGPLTLLGPELEGETLSLNSLWSSKNNSINERFAGAIGNGDHAVSLVYSYRHGHETENNGALPANPVDFHSYASILKGYSRFGNLVLEPTFDFFRLNSLTDLLSIESTDLNGRTLDSYNDSLRTRNRISLDATYTPDSILPAFDELTGKIYYQESLSQNFNPQLLLIDEGLATESLRDRENFLYYQTDIFGTDLKATKSFSTGPLRHLVQYGYDFSRSEVTSALIRTDSPSSPDNIVNMAPSTVWRNGLYLSDRILIGDRDQFVITPSLRLEDYQVEPENTQDFLDLTSFTIFDAFGRAVGTESIEAVDYHNFSVSPSLNALYHINDVLNVYLTTSRGVRNPSAEELTGVFQHEDDFITLPNPDLEEETSFSNEIGLQYDDDLITVELAAYWNFYDNFLESGVSTGQYLEGREIQQTVNRDEVEIYGIEGKASWHLGDSYPLLTGVTVGASGSWSEGSVKDPTTGKEPLNTIEPWKATGWIGYLHPSTCWGVNLTCSFHSGKKEDDIAGSYDPTSDYTLLDLNGFVRLTDSCTVRAGINNLLDEEYVLWSRANRGSGHNGTSSTSRDTQPGTNGFVSVEFLW
ncbi:MAG: TonB-dependent receptor domain-containing protein [Verrucomicrobiales bacterium]